MAAPRPVKWVLVAKDATGGAFQSLNRKMQSAEGGFRRLAGAARAALAAAGIGLGVAGVRGLQQQNKTLRELAITYNATATEVDGLQEAFKESGRSETQIAQILQNVAVKAARAREGNVELAAAFEQFDVDPNQLNAFQQLITLIDNVGKAGKNARFDILSKILSEEGIGAIRQVAASLGSVERFIEEQKPVLADPARTERLEADARPFRQVRRNVEKFGRELLDVAGPLINLPARLLNPGKGGALGELARTPGDVSQRALQTRDAQRTLRVLEEIRDNQRAGGLGP